ncbi:MAG: RidA family protein [Chloroflexi bacterium]|nr:RidA family protein [Chloroflexota bacterium]
MAERERVAINPAGSQPPGVPLTPGIRAGGFIFVSGQVGRGTVGGQAVLGADVREQTAFCLDNIKRVLEAGGSSMDRVVKCTVFMTDIGQFAEMNQVYQSYFSGEPPARTTVQVVALARPNLLVEIEAIALA